MDESKDEIVKVETSSKERELMRDVLAFMKSSDSKWCDSKGQKGPIPADFGDHDPIPLEAICASVVVTSKEEG